MAKYEKLAEAIAAREAALRSDRNTHESLWQDIARHVIPRKATFNEETSPGVERARHILDSTAPRALELFASFLHTICNNPAIQWFLVEADGDGADDVNKLPNVKKWNEEVARRMKRLMESEQCNIYSTLHESFLDMGAFGTSITFVEMPDTLRIRSYHLHEAVIDEDAYGFVDTVIRQVEYSVRQAEQRWPDQEFKATRGKKLKFLHATFPTSDREYADLLPAATKARNDQFASVWVNTEDKSVVKAAGFEDFPYSVPRWYRDRSSVYGSSPAMTVMPDVRMVNRMSETILRGAEKLVDPPLVIPDGGLVSPVRMFPGGLTFSEGNWDPKPLIPPGASRIEVGDGLLKQRQEAIEKGFFVPLFASPDSPVKTATEVLQARDERNRAVSPMITRMQSEQFHRLLMRVFRLMLRANLLPPPPPELGRMQVRVRYVSPLSASQHEMESLGTLRIIESLLPWAQIAPGVLDIFDPDMVAQVVHAGSGAPARILRSSSALAQFRKAKADAAAQQTQGAALAPAITAGAAATNANANMLKAQKA